MEIAITKVINELILPPSIFIFLGLLGLGLTTMWRRQGIFIVLVSMAGLLLSSLPIFASALVGILQSYDPLTEKDFKTGLGKVDAIVVLAGGRQQSSEYGEETVSRFSLERLRYAAWVTKRTGLPLIVSGGRVKNEAKSEAQLMKEVLQKEFIVIVDLLEEQSKNTYENAQFTAELLKEKKYDRILLVTHAWHMRRAKAVFEHFDIEVVPGPTGFYSVTRDIELLDFLPSAESLRYTNIALHEMLGHWWYHIRFY